jgi:phosphatidylinositol glycan class B
MLIRRERFLNLILISAGIIVVAGMGVLIDRWYYGEWTLTVWNYFEQNILNDKVSGFGTEPWWYYISNSFMNGIPPFSLLFIGGIFAMIIFKYKSAVVWTITPFLLIHSIIGHKELRFMFPLVPFLPYLVIQGINITREKFAPGITDNRFFSGFMKLFLIVNAGVLMVVIFSAAKHDVTLFRTLYTKYTDPITLYYIKDNPYGDGVLRMNFYKRESLNIQQIDAVDQIPETGNGLLMLNYRTHEFGTLVYSSYPDWLLQYNVNNWQARSRILYVYEFRR